MLINHIITGMKDYLEKFPITDKKEDRKEKKCKSLELGGSTECGACCTDKKQFVIELLTDSG